MKVKTVSITYGRKFNLGNYNSIEVSCTAWSEVEYDLVRHNDGTVDEVPLDNVDDVYNALFEQAKDHVKARIFQALGREAGTRLLVESEENGN